MTFDKIEATIASLKFFINHNATSSYSFGNMAIQLHRLHYEMNESYYDICHNKKPKCWQDIPLMPIEKFSDNTPLGINLKTKMPFPGVMFQLGKSKHYMRDTELYKDSISRSFPNIVLNEDSWVPWINFVSVYPKFKNNHMNYILEYLADSFHGNALNEMGDFEEFIKQLVEAEGDEVKVKIPTVFVAKQDTYKKFLKNVKKYKELYPEGIILPLGSAIVEINNFSTKSSAKISKDLCNIFDTNQITRMLSISEISSQMYANIKKTTLDLCIKKKELETTEYFSSPWMKVRVIDPETNNEVDPGKTGRIAVYDLANFWSCPFVLTQLYGTIGPRGGLIIDNNYLVNKKETVN